MFNLSSHDLHFLFFCILLLLLIIVIIFLIWEFFPLALTNAFPQETEQQHVSYIYHLFVRSNSNFLHNSLWITFPTQLCLVLYSLCSNLLHLLITWLIISSLSPHNLYLLFCCILSIFAVLLLLLLFAVVAAIIIIIFTIYNLWQ